MRITALLMALVIVVFLLTPNPTVGVVQVDEPVGIVQVDEPDLPIPTVSIAKVDEPDSEKGSPTCGGSASVYIEREDFVLAIGRDAIHSHDFTKNAFEVAWKSDEFRDLRRAFEESGYVIFESLSAVAINISARGAVVIVPTVLETDSEVTEKLVAIVHLGLGRVVATLLGSQVGGGDSRPDVTVDVRRSGASPRYGAQSEPPVSPQGHMTLQCIWIPFYGWWCWWINWCEVACAAITGVATGACVGVCCFYAAPICPVCITLCTLILAGYDACVDGCVDLFH